MKTITKNPLPGSLLALLLLIVAIACKKDNITNLSRNFEVEQSKTYNFEQDGHILASVTLTAIEDSRCPINAFCATAGMGMATLKIKDLSIKDEKTITLYIGDGVPKEKKDLKQININGTNYIIQLRNINPLYYTYTYSAVKPPSTASLSLTKI